jgi:hypothetical protein
MDLQFSYTGHRGSDAEKEEDTYIVVCECEREDARYTSAYVEYLAPYE